MYNREYTILIDLLRASVSGKQVQVPDDTDWEKLLCFANAHHVLALVYNAVKANQIAVPKQAYDKMQQEFFRAIYSDLQYDYMAQQVTDALTARKITHMPLKGIRLKKDYPIPASRTMCDMDLLVYAEDFPAIRREMEKLGGKLAESDGNHRTYDFPCGVMVEFHPNLIHCAVPVCTAINPGWKYAVDAHAEGTTDMTPEGFYVYTMCHLANHFVLGGVGVRYVLDVWVCNHLRKEKYNAELVKREFETIGLTQFAENIENLSEAWFGSGKMTPLLEEIGEYILKSGLQGNTRTATLNALSFTKGGNSFSALWNKVFYPREDFENRYDWVKGKPWLVPAAWCVRLYHALTKRGHLVVKWKDETCRHTKEDIQNNREKLRRFGFK